MQHSKIGRWTSGLGQKHELPRGSIAVRFRPNKQTPDRRGFTTLCATSGLMHCTQKDRLAAVSQKSKLAVLVRRGESTGSRALPAPPPEQTAASQHLTGQSGPSDGARDASLATTLAKTPSDGMATSEVVQV